MNLANTTQTIDPKKFSPRHFTFGVIFIPLLAMVIDLMLRFIVTQGFVFTKGAAFFGVGLEFEVLEQNLIALVEENFHLISAIYSALQIAVFCVFFRLCRKRATPYVFTRAPQAFVWPLLPVLVLAGLGITSLWMNFVQNLSSNSAFWQGVVESYEVVGETLSARDSYFLQFISVVVLVPIAEELLFRGILLSELKQVMKAEWAVVLSALAFGIFHANILQGVYAFLLGVLIGLVYVWTESIWVAILMHMTFNFYGGSLLDLLGLQEQELSVYHWYNVVPLVMILVAIPLVVYLYQHRRPALTVTRRSRFAYALEAVQVLAKEQGAEVNPAPFVTEPLENEAEKEIEA